MWFGEFLCNKDAITPEQLIKGMGEFYSSREPIGKLALECGMLDLKEVGHVLSKQVDDPRPFGQVAMSLELLNQDQIEQLIGRQLFRETVWSYLAKEGFVSQKVLNDCMTEYHRKSMDDQF